MNIRDIKIDWLMRLNLPMKMYYIITIIIIQVYLYSAFHDKNYYNII